MKHKHKATCPVEALDDGISSCTCGAAKKNWDDNREAAWHEMIDGRDAEIARLTEWRKTATAAADAILAPLTMEYGRLMEENPDYEMVVSFGEYAVSLPASKFMALYHATDHD